MIAYSKFQYLEDFANCKDIMGYRYPETLCDEFVKMGLPKDARIIDVACGAGNVAYIVRIQPRKSLRRTLIFLYTNVASLTINSSKNTDTPTLMVWTPPKAFWMLLKKRAFTKRPFALMSLTLKRLRESTMVRYFS